MKATIEVPDDLYRQVKAKSALEGRAVREVTEELFRRYVDPGAAGIGRHPEPKNENQPFGDLPVPPWFGVLKRYADRVTANDMDSIRRSIAAGIVQERDL